MADLIGSFSPITSDSFEVEDRSMKVTGVWKISRESPRSDLELPLQNYSVPRLNSHPEEIALFLSHAKSKITYPRFSYPNLLVWLLSSCFISWCKIWGCNTQKRTPFMVADQRCLDRIESHSIFEFKTLLNSIKLILSPSIL